MIVFIYTLPKVGRTHNYKFVRGQRELMFLSFYFTVTTVKNKYVQGLSSARKHLHPNMFSHPLHLLRIHAKHWLLRYSPHLFCWHTSHQRRWPQLCRSVHRLPDAQASQRSDFDFKMKYLKSMPNWRIARELKQLTRLQIFQCRCPVDVPHGISSQADLHQWFALPPPLTARVDVDCRVV